MCGICGDIRTPGGGWPSSDVLAAMNAAQRHRGPDDTGIWIKGAVGLGHQRLSILDLSGGHQPMDEPSGRVVITYNGEIYNYVELREQLLAKGHRFRGTGDTEVLLHAYLEWGLESLDRLCGMFAFAVYDARKRILFAARDPGGQKPFLYYVDDQGLLFASELVALLRHPRLPRRLDREALARYLVYENFAAPQTPLDGVRKLPPGHALLYRPEEGTLRTWRYWDPLGSEPVIPARRLTAEDEEAFAQQLREAVARHLRSDVPVGIYLSGGVDSAALTTLACDLIGGQNLQTFTIAHPDVSFDESAQARRLAHQLGTTHHEMALTAARCVELVPEAVQHLDEPLADPGYLAVCQAAGLASQHVKVVLAGDGGDELLYGYEPFKVWGAAERLHRLTSPGLRRALGGLIALMPAQYGYMGLWYRARQFLRGLEAPAPVRNSLWLSAFTPREALAVLRDGHALQALRPSHHGWPAVFDEVVSWHRRAQQLDGLARLGVEYQTTYLPDCICAHTDRANMRVSLEARSPFLDPTIIRATNRLPSAWKLRGWQSKWILRRWLARRLGYRLPAKKRGFTVPIARWLRQELRGFAEPYLSREALEQTGVFEEALVQRLWREHQRGIANHAKPLWTLIVFQVWWFQHLRGQAHARPVSHPEGMKMVVAGDGTVGHG